MRKYITLLLSILYFQGFTQAIQEQRTFYIAVNGNDSDEGTFTAPFATLEKARSVVAKLSKDPGLLPITVYLRAGTYRLTEPVIFTTEDSGSKESPVTYKAYPGEHPMILGSKKLELKWKSHKNGIFKASVKDENFEELYADRKKQILARYPNFNQLERPFNGTAQDVIAPEKIKEWKQPEGAYFHVLHAAQWGAFHYRITGVNENAEAILDGGWQNNRPANGLHKKFRFVENIFEELDTINEWYFDKKKKTIYWKPGTGVDPNDALIEIPRLNNLIVLKGNASEPVSNIHFEGIDFRHTYRTFMETREPLLRSDWAIYRGGAVFMDGTENCSVKKCNFQDLGGNAIFVSNYARGIEISHNRITQIGANAISFVGDPEAVRSPSFAYADFVSYEEMDKDRGPKTDNYPAQCLAHDNLIFDIGLIEKQIAGVQIAMASEITVSHNSIYRTPRAGINIGDGTWGGHLLEYNDVFETVLETSDHGSFNSWGRDRYWSASQSRVNQYVAAHPELPLLDAIKTTIIRNNRFRCDHGWDIDLDDGSTNYEIYNNLCLANGIKLREGYYRKVYNNITVNNSMHIHVWYDNSGDIITGNIFGSWYWPIRMPEKWGTLVDHNLFDLGERPLHFNDQDRDLNSFLANPEFLDPSKGDYRISSTSPALKIGFHNFSMDNFGVVSPHLKKEANTPQLPDYVPGLQKGEEPQRDNKIFDWLGGKVKNLTGMGEVSATGMFAEVGVLIQEVPTGSQLEKFGFKENDVIYEYWGGELENVSRLFKNYEGRPRGVDIPITILRNQQKMQLHLK
ncbi:peptide-binding protein [Fulvivirgaceae bacterium BMA10]|uniref:Peptide-binding protein n=1 Tax=Splendidivirga corallicola TaxID=3051826 RepID=A0ABT8KPW2_9BACT|nr:peptide-binding protein [Fulvivirgaceae bacterium BMA10]